MGRFSGRILLDGDYVKTENDARMIAKERETPGNNPNFITLRQALDEATATPDAEGCCSIN
jgi:hypothetical protein